jgi:hypothetical protein
MKRVFSRFIFALIIYGYFSNSLYAYEDKEYQIKTSVEIVAIQNYANYWIYIGDKKELFEKFIMDDKPHKLDKGFIIISLAGIDNKGHKEIVSKTEKNIKYTIKDKVVSFLEGKYFELECTDIIDNIPYCIVHINEEFTFNQYLLMKGVSKFSSKEYIPHHIKSILQSAEKDAQKNKSGVWAPFYGVFEDF